ncbi:HAD family hydrolase [Actinospica durhamensis]|uniref:HAD family hydrolase n=1 Tax=Actinospica durhamensis TaxID=1508375 RepID=A0A941EP59_9ACTN|nr:HAD family hydrolase [Actinospica durhamensis]MBR7834621.1 HAD family hydrolase [Actinospica durhamensis]
MNSPHDFGRALPLPRSPLIDAVVFDVGETLVDESVEYHGWADWLGVPRHTFSAVFGAVIGSGRGHLDVFEYFKPGFDLAAERRARAEAGRPEGYGERDLYPDARPVLAALQQAGYLVVIAANQTRSSHRVLEALRLPVDRVTTSDTWGISKPDPRFFAKVIETCDELRPGIEAGRVMYVGDRLDNDLRPAWEAGLRTAHVRRGPWGYVHAEDPDLQAKADLRMDSLSELPALLAEL